MVRHLSSASENSRDWEGSRGLEESKRHSCLQQEGGGGTVKSRSFREGNEASPPGNHGAQEGD